MKNTFEQLEDNKRRRELFTMWLSRVAFGSSTYRMLKGKIQPKELRRFFIRRLGNCAVLAKCTSQQAYDTEVKQCTHALCRLRPRIPYGHAAKCVSIYVKAAAVSRGALSDAQARKIRRFAHLPIDRVILNRVWKDFGTEKAGIPIRKTTALNKITPEQYAAFQAFLRCKAEHYGFAPLDYDFAWADREN